MKKHLAAPLLLVLMLILAACAPVATPQPVPTIEPATPQPTVPATPAGDPTKAPAVENNRRLLARQLHIDPATIQVIGAEQVDWSDSCLGAGLANELCAAVITPGYKITFSVDGQTYVVHTDRDGYQSRVVAAPEPITGAPIMQWTGTVDNGNCYEAIIGAEGVGFGLCYGPAKIGGKFATEARQAVLAELARKYAPFEADGEFGHLIFKGSGATVATAEDQVMITRWAQQVTLEAAGGESLAGMEYRGPAQMGSSDTSKCAVLRLGTPIEAVVGACDGTATDKDMGKRTYQDWEYLRDTFAPFVYETATESITFDGMGLVSGEAWQRAILAWARARHAELSTGKTSATISTAMSWHLGQDFSQKNVCLHLTVLDYGYAYAEERMCEGGDVLTTSGDWLTSEELFWFDKWLYERAPLNVNNNYFAGEGTTEMTEADQAELGQWATNVHARLSEAAARANLPSEALAKCPAANDSAQSYIDARRGFCLLLPATYSAFSVNPNEVVFVKESLLNVTEPRLSISVVGAGARTLDQVVADILTGLPAYDFQPSTVDIAGQSAAVLDNVPGQDLMRRVIFISNGRLYDLTFSPADHADLETFYSVAVASLQLLPPAQ